MAAVTRREMMHGKTRFDTYYQGEVPAIGVEIKPGGVIVVGYYIEDGRWVTLHTAVPPDIESQIEYRKYLLGLTPDDGVDMPMTESRD